MKNIKQHYKIEWKRTETGTTYFYANNREEAEEAVEGCVSSNSIGIGDTEFEFPELEIETFEEVEGDEEDWYYDGKI